MITEITSESSRWTSVKARYERWEARRLARLTGWSVARRWTLCVLLPTLVFCCGGSVFGVPVAWVLRETVEASKGAVSPDAAANEYLMALGYNNDEGLLPILDNDHQDELLAGWRAYRKAMDTTTPPPARLDFGALTVGPERDGQVEVTTEVSATWWATDGRALAYSSGEYTWRIRTRNDNGWQVVAVDAPQWCGGYVRPDACTSR